MQYTSEFRRLLDECFAAQPWQPAPAAPGISIVEKTALVSQGPFSGFGSVQRFRIETGDAVLRERISTLARFMKHSNWTDRGSPRGFSFEAAAQPGTHILTLHELWHAAGLGLASRLRTYRVPIVEQRAPRGWGYAFMQQPSRVLLSGPGRFAHAHQHFELRSDTEIDLRFEACPRPDGLLGIFGVDPFYAALDLASANDIGARLAERTRDAIDHKLMAIHNAVHRTVVLRVVGSR